MSDRSQQYTINQSIPISEGSADRRHVFPGDQQDIDRDERWSEPFYFIQAADTQLGLIDRYIKKVENPRWDEEIRLCEMLVEKCNKMTPRPLFLVVCGDLVDAAPVEGQHETRREQISDFKRIFSKLDPSIPLVCVCGNHDVGDEPTLDSLCDYKKDFGDDYFYFVKRGVLFIVINSQFYKHRANLESYASAQDEWLEIVLSKCRQYKHSIVFQHIPWYLKSPFEQNDYFNIDRLIRKNWLRKFYLAGVSKIMCGHYHRNAGAKYFPSMEVVVTSAVGGQLDDPNSTVPRTYSSGARIVRIYDDRIVHRYCNLDELLEEVEK